MNDSVFIALQEEKNLWNIAFPLLRLYKERKWKKRIFLITDIEMNTDTDLDNVEDVLYLDKKLDFLCVIKFFRIIQISNNVVFLSVSDKNGSGIEKLILNGRISADQYVKVALMDLGGVR